MSYPDLSHHGFSTRVVEPWGSGSSRVLVVGEAPGEQEDAHGEPFWRFAPAGSILERVLNRMGVSRDTLRITNVVWQRPPRNWLEGAPWENAAVEAWRPYLDALIQEMQPKVIVALGNVALRRFTPYGGKGATITNVRGYVMPSDYPGTWIVPTYHPSYILQGQHAQTGVLIYDLSRAFEIAKRGFTRQPVRYVTNPTPDDMLTFERGYDPSRHVLSFDIETPKSGKLTEDELEEADESYNIVRASLCYDSPYAISFPWMQPYIESCRRMLGSSGPKRVWNASFDVPRLASNDCPVNGRCYDMMEAWSFLQRSLPRSLGFVTPFYGWTGEPWKHTSDSEPEYYSCADAHALQQNGDGIERDLRAQGRWESFERHVVDLTIVLNKMSRNGLPYSIEAAQEFGKKLEGLYDDRFLSLQSLVPDELKPRHPKDGYKREPADKTGMVEIDVPVVQEVLGERQITTVKRWAELQPFLPTSWQQVLELIRSHGFKPPTNRKTRKDTTDEDGLKKLAQLCRKTKKHTPKAEVYDLIVECRQLRKVLGTYVNGWKPGSDGRIHATPGFWGKMYRISWRRPNIAATIADKTEAYIAAGFRKCVQTTPGKLLLESDWRGIEAVIVGYFAEDKDYMRLARLGVHAFMASHMMDEPSDLALPDEELTQRFRFIKRHHHKLYDDAKHTVHGTNYGMGPKLMAEMYGMTITEAKRLQDLYFALFPKVRAWQLRVLAQAHQEVKLTNPYGYTMWFWDVYRWDSRKFDKLRKTGLTEAEAREKAWALGEDAKSSIAFMPRDTAAGMLKDAVLRLAPLADRGIMLSTTHDAILTEVRESELDEVASLVRTEMERPVPLLGGLSIGVEQKYGSCWAEDEMQVLTPQATF